jgi:hypothetical protein
MYTFGIMFLFFITLFVSPGIVVSENSINRAEKQQLKKICVIKNSAESGKKGVYSIATENYYMLY